MLKFSACMRAHGLTKFPDPDPSGGISIGRNSGIDPNSPQFKAAEKACKELPARRRRVLERAGGDAVSIVRSSTSRTAGRPARRWRLRRPGRRWLAGAAALVVAVGVVVAVVNPFAGGAGSAAGAPDSGSATSLATVERRSLTSQALVDGTLGYAGSSSIVVPAGTSQADLRRRSKPLPPHRRRYGRRRRRWRPTSGRSGGRGRSSPPTA